MSHIKVDWTIEKGKPTQITSPETRNLSLSMDPVHVGILTYILMLSWLNFQLFNSIIQWFRVIWLHSTRMPSIFNGSRNEFRYKLDCKYGEWGGEEWRKILNFRLQTKTHFEENNDKDNCKCFQKFSGTMGQ